MVGPGRSLQRICGDLNRWIRAIHDVHRLVLFMKWARVEIGQSTHCLWHFISCTAGVLNFSFWGFYYQLQAVAHPADVNDPLLRTWVKPPALNPLDMRIPPGGNQGPR
jgi:hypothetical protein